MNFKKTCFFFLVVFGLFIFWGVCSARDLEVAYPTLPTGEQLTPDTTLPKYALYVYKFGFFWGFFIALLSLIVAGAFYVFSLTNPSLREKAKDRIYGVVTGTILLLLIYLIASTINPELTIFKDIKFAPITSVPPPKPVPSGVTLYKTEDCTDELDNPLAPTPTPYVSSIEDLSVERKTLTALKITPDSARGVLYFAITHDLAYFKGYCQYFYENDNQCKKANPFVSVSIYQYAQTPTGNSVTFYRYQDYDPKGGWLRIKNNNIGGLYQREFKKLTFNGDGGDCTVPENEQDCLKWEEDGQTCKKENRQCPSLAGENVNSIRIDGNYVVVLLYWNRGDNYNWLICQVFPTFDDINKYGPRQIKWEYIRLRNNLPNWVLIFPIVKAP